MHTFQDMYQALIRKDSSFEGTFIVGVKTTGIFCRPTCTARKPKPDNIVFYKDCKEAILEGYRPCKICKPLERVGQTPEYIQVLLREVLSDPFARLTDWKLRKRGIEPSQIRRWFKKHHNMTFHAYQRMMRLNQAYLKINNGQKVTPAAFESGYESLSGFNERFQSIFGAAPSQAKDKIVIDMIRLTSPLGPMIACATDKGICLLEWTDRRMLETEFRDLQKRLKAVILPGTNTHLEQLKRELKEYFDGKRRVFEVSLHTPSTGFREDVWAILCTIPYGSTASYKEQAARMNKPKAVRAVGGANGHNRVAIVIPCHRVIGENGNLTGYGGGLSRKKWLLDFEKSNVDEDETPNDR